MAATHALTVGHRSYPVALPSLRDPRLHVAAVIISVHVLGQVALHFRVTVPQILAAIFTCAVIEILLTFRKSGTLVWPASAMLTGSGVALILRTTDTVAGDPWGTTDWYVFAGVAGLALLSKYVIQFRGTHLFNPSNLGLVVAFLLLGVERVQPLDFYWGPPSVALGLAYVLIVGGGSLIDRRLHLLAMAGAYWITLTVGTAILAGSGHCMVADWAFGPICGFDFWRTIVISPEVLVFLFFMLTDPKTIPAGRVARFVFAVAVGVGTAVLMAPQTTEWATKVALLTSLVILCATRPLFERYLPKPNTAEDHVRSFLARAAGRGSTGGWRSRPAARLSFAALVALTLAGVIVLAGVPARGIAGARAFVYLDAARKVDPESLPSVVIDSSITTWDVTKVTSDAPGLALTLAENLEVENLALMRRDPNVLASVDHGDRLKEMTAALDAGKTARETTITHYAFHSLFMTTELLGSQSGLGIAFKAHGTQTIEKYDSNAVLTDEQTVPFALTFVIRQSIPFDARWFNVGVLPGA